MQLIHSTITISMTKNYREKHNAIKFEEGNDTLEQ